MCNHSLDPIGSIAKLTMCPNICQVDDKMSIWFIGQTVFIISQSRIRPINLST